MTAYSPDYSTETSTRKWEMLPPDDTTLTDVPTPEIDTDIIEHEAERVEKAHPFTPPEPGPGDEPESEDGDEDVGRDGEEVADRWERPTLGEVSATQAQ